MCDFVLKIAGGNEYSPRKRPWVIWGATREGCGRSHRHSHKGRRKGRALTHRHQRSPGLRPLAWLLFSWKETHLKTIAWPVCCSERNCVARTFHLQDDSWMTGACTCFACHSLVWLISSWGFGLFDKAAPLASLKPPWLAAFLPPPSTLLWHSLPWMLSVCISKEQDSVNCSWERCTGTTLLFELWRVSCWVWVALSFSRTVYLMHIISVVGAGPLVTQTMPR